MELIFQKRKHTVKNKQHITCQLEKDMQRRELRSGSREKELLVKKGLTSKQKFRPISEGSERTISHGTWDFASYVQGTEEHTARAD